MQGSITIRQQFAPLPARKGIQLRKSVNANAKKAQYEYEILGRAKGSYRMDSEDFGSKREWYVQPLNGDPFMGFQETPFTSDEAVVWLLSNLPGNKMACNPVSRGVEVGLAHGFWIPGPFIKLGPQRDLPFPQPEIVGCSAAVFMVLAVTVWMVYYGYSTFRNLDAPLLVPGVGTKTLSGRPVTPDPIWSTDEGWRKFTAGQLVGGLAGVAWCYIMCLTLPYYHLEGFY